MNCFQTENQSVPPQNDFLADPTPAQSNLSLALATRAEWCLRQKCHNSLYHAPPADPAQLVVSQALHSINTANKQDITNY